MRKGADSFGRPTGGHASRGVRHPRRRDTVWLVTGAASNLALSSQPHHTAGALALDHANSESAIGTVARRCALIVEGDPALAEALTRALQEQLAPVWPIRRISDSHMLTALPQGDAPEIMVLDTIWSESTGADGYQRLSMLPELDETQLIFVTSDTSYQLSQRGVVSGVILREWLHPDDIVTLVAEALADGEANA